jgi:hypothetical protein
MPIFLAILVTLSVGTACSANDRRQQDGRFPAIPDHPDQADNVPNTSQSVLANDLTCTAKRQAYVRLVPDGDSIGTIHKGDIFAPIEVKDDWIHTQVNRSLHGWISNQVLDCRWTPRPHTTGNQDGRQ